MKILVSYASAGAGHKRCAEAIYDLLKRETNQQVSLVDCLDYTNFLFKFLYSFGYTFLITYLPSLWSALFKFTNLSIFFITTRPLQQLIHNLSAIRFIKFLIEERFDYCICTQFLSSEIVSRLKTQRRINTKLVCVITDYNVHHLWLAEGVDIYIVACRETKQRLIQLGVAEEKIKVTGIPVNLRFLTQPDKLQLLNKLGLKSNLFTVLILTGAFGIGPLQKIVAALEDRFQLLVVCGNNKKLLRKLNSIKNIDTHVYGLVDNVDELMAVSDLVITKPGGLTISEALVRHLPMLFILSIPGQETENARLMINYNIGLMAKNSGEIKKLLTAFMVNRNTLAYMKANTWRLSKPFAGRELLKIIHG